MSEELPQPSPPKEKRDWIGLLWGSTPEEKAAREAAWEKSYAETTGKKLEKWKPPESALDSIKSEDQLVAVLRAHAYVEGQLVEMLRAALMNPEGAWIARHLDFAKVNGLAWAVGLIGKDAYGYFKKLGELRNALGHKHDAQLSDDQMWSLINLHHAGAEDLKGYARKMCYGDSVVHTFRAALMFALFHIDAIAEDAKGRKVVPVRPKKKAPPSEPGGAEVDLR